MDTREKITKLIDHYLDSGDVGREELIDSLVEIASEHEPSLQERVAQLEEKIADLEKYTKGLEFVAKYGALER